MKSEATDTHEDGHAMCDIALISAQGEKFVDDWYGFMYLLCHFSANTYSVATRVAAHAQNTLFAIAFLASWIEKAPAKFSADFVDGTFKQLWRPVIARFRLHIPSTAKTQVYRPFASGLRGNLDQASCETAAVALANIAKYCLQDERLCCTSIPKLVEQTSGASAEKLLHILLPFLRRTQAQIEHNWDDLGFGMLGYLFTNTIDRFLRNYVQDQPAGVYYWSRPTVSCDCNDCFELNLFHTSVTQESRRFQVSKNRRQHLHVQLDRSRADCTHESMYVGIQRVLVVTKRNRGKMKYDAWLVRCRQAHEELTSFDQDVLRQLLKQNYAGTMALALVVFDAASSPDFLQPRCRTNAARENRTLPESSSRSVSQHTGKVAGMKRKAEVIDLCSDTE